MIHVAVSILLQAFGISYAWLDQNLIEPVLSFARGFEFAVVCAAAILFFLISMFLIMKQARKLPKSYSLEITNVYGEKVAIDGVRQEFATYDVAMSYARMYGNSFGRQYKFKVIGYDRELAQKHR